MTDDQQLPLPDPAPNAPRQVQCENCVQFGADHLGAPEGLCSRFEVREQARPLHYCGAFEPLSPRVLTQRRELLLNAYRRKVLDNTITLDQLRRAMALLREDRYSARDYARRSKRRTAKKPA